MWLFQMHSMSTPDAPNVELHICPEATLPPTPHPFFFLNNKNCIFCPQLQ